MRRLVLFIILPVALLAAAACGGTAAPEHAEPVPTATLAPTSIPTPAPTITVIQFGTPDPILPVGWR